MNGLWLVCFTERKDCIRSGGTRLALTSRHFRHCYVIQYQPEAKRWVLMDWRSGMMDLVAFEHDELKYILGQLKGDEWHRRTVQGGDEEEANCMRIPLIHCVSAVLQVLGLPTHFTMTPKQLYKRLMKSGGEEIVNYRETPMSSGGGGGGLSAEQQEINAITLRRLKTEEEDLEKTEAEKRRILASGRTGRSSLLTLGFLGPGSGSFMTRASTRAAEREQQKTGAATSRTTAARKRQTPKMRGWVILLQSPIGKSRYPEDSRKRRPRKTAKTA